MARVTLGRIKREIGLGAQGCCAVFRSATRHLTDDDLPSDLLQLLASIEQNGSITEEQLALFASYVVIPANKYAVDVQTRTDEYFKMCVARAIFSDSRLQDQFGVESPCYFNLLFPAAKNSKRLNETAIDNEGFLLFYLDDFIVHERDILMTLQLTGRFCNPFFPSRVLPDAVVKTMCINYSDSVKQSIDEHIESVDVFPTDALSFLVDILSPVCLVADQGDSFAGGVEGFRSFIGNMNNICQEYGDNLRTLRCHHKGLSIQDYINRFIDPPSEGFCLSDAAINICQIVTMVIDGRRIRDKYLAEGFLASHTTYHTFS